MAAVVFLPAVVQQGVQEVAQVLLEELLRGGARNVEVPEWTTGVRECWRDTQMSSMSMIMISHVLDWLKYLTMFDQSHYEFMYNRSRSDQY